MRQPFRGAPENTVIDDLSQQTRRLIAQTARRGVRLLGDLPHLDNGGLVRPNLQYPEYPRSKYIKHSIVTTTIAPPDYNAPQIEGLDGVRLESTFIESNVTRLRILGGAVLGLPSLSRNRAVGVALRKELGKEDTRNQRDIWRSSREFTISTQGQALPAAYEIGQHPALQLAAAGLVAQAVEQAHGVDIGLGETQELYATWLQNDARTPEPPPGQPMWSVFNKL